jgi:hypothetical protein
MLGERGLGIQASQRLAVARWAQTMAGANNGVRVERSSQPAHLLDAPVPYRAAPELFGLDLLTALAEPTSIHREGGQP